RVRLAKQDWDFAALTAQFQQAVDPDQMARLALDLGLSAHSLERFGIGWSADSQAWSFPMRDASGKIIGIRLRLAFGRKLAVRGSKDGLFVPADIDVEAPAQLFFTEGVTDAAALLQLGFPAVIGRPSCSGGIKLLGELVQRVQPRGIVIVADQDAPGQ